MKKKIVSAVLLITMSVSLVACGDKDKAKTAESKEADLSASEVISKMSEASVDVKGIDAKASINLDASVKSGDEEASMAIKGDMTVKATEDPLTAYVNADMSVEADTDSQDMKYEVYCVLEDDEYKVYFGNDSDGWMKTEMSLDELGIDMSSITGSMEGLDELYSDENIEEYFDELKVTEKKVNGKACYSVKGNLSDELLNTSIESLGSLIVGESFNAEDIPDITITVEICTDKETNLPAAFYINAEVGENEYVDLKKCEMSIEYNGYDVDEITVPEDALNGIDISESLNAVGDLGI